MKIAELAWSAGLIDGEGCIHIKYTIPSQAQGARNPQHNLYLKVTMTHEQTIDRIFCLFGLGSIQRHQNKGANHSPAYTWLCCSVQAAEAIRLVRPYLITKAEEADIALEFAAIPRGKGSSHMIPREVLLARHDCYTRICQAKTVNTMRNIKPKLLAETLPGKENTGRFQKHTI